MAYSIQDLVIIADSRDIVNAGVVTAQKYVGGDLELTDDIVVGGGVSIGGDINLTGDLNVGGIATIGGITVDGPDVTTRNISATGILTAPISSIGVATAFDLTIYNQLKDSKAAIGVGNSVLATVGGKLLWTRPEEAGISTSFAPGSTFYVAENGSNDNDGLTPSTPWASITYALTQMSDAVHDVLEVGAGDYTETFPLVVPKGVTIKGAGQRATLIRPTSATETNDGFKLNNASTVEDLSIGDMYKPAGGGNNSYAFSYNVGAAITTRSPYVSRVSVINRGTNTTDSDPYGYASADNYPVSAPGAGGVYVDGSVVDSTSLEAGFLLNEVTLFVPANEGLRLTNGARSEVLNSFIYFASQGIVGEAGSTGLAGQGKTRLSLDNASSTPSGGDTIEYYDTDGTTVLASGTVDSADATYVFLTDAGTGFFEVPRNRSAIPVNFVGDAEISADQARFGATSLKVTTNDTDVATAEGAGFGFETGDFTVEGWFYFNSLSSGDTLIDFRNASAGEGRLSVEIGAANSLDVSIAGTAVLNGGTLTTGSWIHVAVTRSSGTLRAFLDGNQVDSAANATNLGTTGTLHIGADFLDTNGVEAYVDDFRVTKGASKYDATFTAPTTTLKADKDTSILLHFEGSDGDTTTTDDILVYQDIRFTGGGTADKLTLADYSQFGADLRCVGSAVEYGNRGVFGDGAGVTLRLISINFNHIGALGDISNDPNLVIQTNEVIESNNAEVSYVSIDQKGDFRVGEAFFVDQETGTVSFQDTVTDLTALSSLTITDGTNSSLITPTSGRFGNIQISGNQIESTTGDVNVVTAGSGEVNIYGNTNVIGILTAASISLQAIQNGDTSIALDDTGTDGTIRFITDGSEAGRFDNSNDLTVTRDVIVGRNLDVTDDLTAAQAVIGVATITTLNVGSISGGAPGGGGGSQIGDDISTRNLEVSGIATVNDLRFTTGLGTNLNVSNQANILRAGINSAVITNLQWTDAVGGAATITSLTVGTLTGGAPGGGGSGDGTEITEDLVSTRFLNVSGVATIGTLGVTTDLSVGEDVSIGRNLDVAGLSTFVGVSTFRGDVFIQGNLIIDGDNSQDKVDTTNLVVTGIATIGELDVVTDTLLQRNLQVGGASTFTGDVDVDGYFVGAAGTFANDLGVDGHMFVGGNLIVTGRQDVEEFFAQNMQIIGVGSFGTVDTNNLEFGVGVGTTAIIQDLAFTNGVFTNLVGLTTAQVAGGSTISATFGRFQEIQVENFEVSVDGLDFEFAKATNVLVTGIATHNLIKYNQGIGTFQSVTGILTAADLQVTGFSTFSNAVDITTDLRVGGATTITGDLNVSGNVNVTGDIVYDEVSGRNLNISGVATIGTLGVTTNLSVGELLFADEIRSDSFTLINSAGTQPIILAPAGGPVAIYHTTGAPNFITNDNGAQINNDLIVTRNLVMGGIATIPNLIGTAATFTSLTVTNFESEGGGSSIGDDITTRNLEVTGIATIATLGVTTSLAVGTGGTATEIFDVFGNSHVNGFGLFASSGNAWADNSDPGIILQSNGTNGAVINIKTSNLYNNDSVFQVLEDGFQGQNVRARITSQGDASFGAGNVQIHKEGGASFVGIVTANEFDSQSDVRLKKHIRTIDNALNRVREINGVEFTWKETNERTMGVIAQQVEEAFPDLVRGNDTLSVNYNGLIGVLIESIKELKLRVEELEEKQLEE